MSHIYDPMAAQMEAQNRAMQESLARNGQIKDEAKKEHPCMVQVASVPREQQAKDFIFRAVVHAMKEILR